MEDEEIQQQQDHETDDESGPSEEGDLHQDESRSDRKPCLASIAGSSTAFSCPVSGAGGVRPRVSHITTQRTTPTTSSEPARAKVSALLVASSPSDTAMPITSTGLGALKCWCATGSRRSTSAERFTPAKTSSSRSTVVSARSVTVPDTSRPAATSVV